MKKLIFAFCLSFISVTLFSQDSLVKRNASVLIVKVLELTDSTISYKRLDIPDGPIRIDYKHEIAYVRYANGLKESFAPAAQKESVSRPTIVTLAPTNRKSNRIQTVEKGLWEQNGKLMYEPGLKSLLTSTKDPEIMSLLQSAEKDKKHSFVKYAVIPFAITGAGCAILAIASLGSGEDNAFPTLASCAVVSIVGTIGTAIYGSKMSRSHKTKNIEAIELYNQRY